MSDSDDLIEWLNDEDMLEPLDGKVPGLIVETSKVYGFFHVSNLEKFKNGLKYESYSLKDVKGYPIVTGNDVYGYNLEQISLPLKRLKITDIYIPTEIGLAYFLLDGGNVLTLAPYMLKDNEYLDHINVHKLSKPNQTLNKFW